MTDEEHKLMDQFGITAENKTVYHFKGYKYDNLAHAVSYAKTLSGPEAKEVNQS